MAVLRVLFWSAVINFLCLGALTCYYGMTCPTVSSIESGHIYPFFDKIYDRYVYVTKSEQEALPILLCVGVGCVFASVLIDLDLRRKFRSSRQNDSA
jgi:hypothetical protein